MRSSSEGATEVRARLAMIPVVFAVAFALACTPDAPASRAGASPAGPSAPVARFRTVRSWPHDPAAFTQGLDFHNGRLFEGTGVEGQSTLREITLETGAVVRKVNLPSDVFGEGITVLGDRIYQVTWKSRKGYVYDVATLRRLREFTYEGEGWGLTNDGA